MKIVAYQGGIYPRSEAVVAATRGLERGRTAAEEVAAAVVADREDFVAAQRAAGLDLFSDGLLGWQDIFRPLVESGQGMEARTLVRWFDNNAFFRAPEVSGAVSLDGIPSELDQSGVPEPRVATLPSPYLFSRAAHTTLDRNALMVEFAREVLRPLVGELARRGYRLVQLQEPWLPFFGMDPADWDEFEKALQEVRDGLGTDAGTALVLHLYFGDVGPHADRLRRLPVDAVGVDFVATDLEALGTGWSVGLLAGVLDGRNSVIEPVESTVAFLARVAEMVQPSALFVSSSCDLELLPRDVARQKVLRLGEISAGAKEALS